MPGPSILLISGSIRPGSTNWKLLGLMEELLNEKAEIIRYPSLADLPHFDPDPELGEIPAEVTHFRQLIEQSDAVVICSPEYIFAIPAVLKNALEWLVATTILDKKPIALITASALGDKSHEQTLLILKTMSAEVQSTNLLVSGIRAKLDKSGNPINELLKVQLQELSNRLISKLHR